MTQYKIFGFIRKVIVLAITLFSCNALECVSMNNQECKARPEVIAINSNVPLFYPYSIKINNAVVVVIISMIHMQNCVFLMILKA